MDRVAAERVTDLPYYAFKKTRVFGEPALVSRTGYTGEDGFEIYLEAGVAEKAGPGFV